MGTGTKTKRKFPTFPYLLSFPLNYSLPPLPPGRQFVLCCPAHCSLAVYSVNFYHLCSASGEFSHHLHCWSPPSTCGPSNNSGNKIFPFNYEYVSEISHNFFLASKKPPSRPYQRFSIYLYFILRANTRFLNQRSDIIPYSICFPRFTLCLQRDSMRTNVYCISRGSVLWRRTRITQPGSFITQGHSGPSSPLKREKESVFLKWTDPLLRKGKIPRSSQPFEM